MAKACHLDERVKFLPPRAARAALRSAGLWLRLRGLNRYPIFCLKPSLREDLSSQQLSAACRKYSRRTPRHLFQPRTARR